MRKKRKAAWPGCARSIVFREALLPMEAAVFPAGEKRGYGALGMVPRAWDAAKKGKNQRAKIWVR